MVRVVSRQSSIRLSGCKIGYTTRQAWSDSDCSLALMIYTDAEVEIDGPTIVDKVPLAESHWAPPAVNRLPPPLRTAQRSSKYAEGQQPRE